MCTVSWEFFPVGERGSPTQESDKKSFFGYRVYFNRDEQRSRVKALPPHVNSFGDIQYICPVDPQGGGTWCAVNELGYTVALLNYYQGRFPKGKLRSRGELVKNSAQFENADSIEGYLSSVNLQKYPPFSLLFFSPYIKSVVIFRWTGKSLERSVQESPLISSAKYFDEVNATRSALYRKQVGVDAATRPTKEDFLSLHKSHEPEKSAYSMCMHRADAQTVSFSCVEVNAEEISYFYTDGPPCESPITKAATLAYARSD